MLRGFTRDCKRDRELRVESEEERTRSRVRRLQTRSGTGASRAIANAITPSPARTGIRGGCGFTRDGKSSPSCRRRAAGRDWREITRARDRDVVPKTAIRSLLRARRYTRADSMFSKLGNIPSEFKELLERCFCVFLKIIRIPSGFEELLEMLRFKCFHYTLFYFEREYYTCVDWS